MPELPLVHVSRPPDDPSENAPTSENLPAVVLLHGLGGDEPFDVGQ